MTRAVGRPVVGHNALIIVHLSSLDSFTWQAGRDAGEALGFSIAEAIRRHDGPVYIVDQGWELGRRESRPRERIIEVARSERPDAVWIKFDEATDDWAPFLAVLKRRLKRDGVGQAEVGGIWYDPGLATGCATEVYLSLRRVMPTIVRDDLVGCESDIAGRGEVP